MYYLVYVNELGQPTQLYGPAEWEVCKRKLKVILWQTLKIVTDNYALNQGTFFLEAGSIKGWHIIGCKPFPRVE